MAARELAIGLAAALACGGARAEGFYAAFGAGAVAVADADNEGGGLKAEDTTERGYGLTGALGWAWGGGFRLEGELAYARNDFDDVTIEQDAGLGAALGLGSLNGLTLDAGGQVTALSAMANLYYDVPTGGPLTPYVGAGLGIARVSAEFDIGPVRLVDDRDSVLAYQAMAGLAWRATPRLAVYGGYRYFATEDATFRDNVLGRSFDSEYRSHRLEIGLRLGF